MMAPAHVSRLSPRPSWAARGLVWLCVAWVLLAGLMSVSPALHAAFCPYEQVRQHPAPATEKGDHADHPSNERGDLDPADDNCIATLFQTGLLPALILCLLAAAPSFRAVAHFRLFTVPEAADPVGLLPPACGPPLGTG